MIENKELGLKIAETSDEAFWTETKEQSVKARESEKRNIKINDSIIALCDEQLKCI